MTTDYRRVLIKPAVILDPRVYAAEPRIVALQFGRVELMQILMQTLVNLSSTLHACCLRAGTGRWCPEQHVIERVLHLYQVREQPVRLINVVSIVVVVRVCNTEPAPNLCDDGHCVASTACTDARASTVRSGSD